MVGRADKVCNHFSTIKEEQQLRDDADVCSSRGPSDSSWPHNSLVGFYNIVYYCMGGLLMIGSDYDQMVVNYQHKKQTAKINDEM